MFSTPPRMTGAGHVARVLVYAICLLAAIEMALQLRFHLTTGQSVLTWLRHGNTYIEDEKSGLRLLRPNSVVAGKKVTLRANSLGLRSPEIKLERTPGSWRIAVIGASTVMGLYAGDTDKTFSARLEQRLRQAFPGKKIEVVNAGIMGYTLDDQRRMLETHVATLRPDLTIVYPGFNDFWAYCQPASTVQAQPRGLPQLAFPTWLYTVDEIRKRSVFLRTAQARQPALKNPDDIDLRPYRKKLETLIGRADALHMPLLLATVSRAYRREQPIGEQVALSTSARNINPCLDLDGLHVLYDRHNDLIEAVAAARGIPVIPLDELIPGGRRYFADAQHFTETGEQLVGDALAGFIVGKHLLPGADFQTPY